jgi:polysaccharide biosynthesis transport protein
LSTNESHDTVTPQRVVRILWRRKLVCLIAAAVVFLGGSAYLVTRPHVYESSSSVALLPVSNNASVLPNYPNLIASLIPTYVQLVSSPILLNRVAPALPFPMSPDQLANDVHAESLSNAAVINIVADNADPVRAQQIAAATTAAFLAHVHGNGVVIAQVYARPTVPATPASPRTKLLLAVILLLAIVIGLAAGLIWDRLSGRPEDGDAPDGTATGPPLLGVVPDPERNGVVASVHGGPGAVPSHDGWQSLRTNFLYAMLGERMHSVTVLSPRPGAGKTAVAANLAATVAEMGMAVVLVDADVHRSALHEVFGLDNWQGLTSTVVDGVDPATLLRPAPAIASLQVITAGPPLPAQYDEAALYRDQLPRLTSLADLVIVDGPSLDDEEDADLAAKVTDGVVLVVGARTGTGKHVEAAVHRLAASGARVLGTVLTGTGGPAGEPIAGQAPRAAGGRRPPRQFGMPAGTGRASARGPNGEPQPEPPAAEKLPDARRSE